MKVESQISRQTGICWIWICPKSVNLCISSIISSKLLEEHQAKCEEGGRFVEAEMAKQRVSQFKKIENQKLLKELKVNHENRKKQLEEEFNIELQTFNEDQDKKFLDMDDRYQEEQKRTLDRHEKEINEKTEEFNKEFPVLPKFSTEYLNMNKILEGLVKQKE
jgi:hypothetical protein